MSIKNAASQRGKGVLFASATAVLWGSLAIALKVSSGFLDAYTIVWSRFFVAFTILFFYLYFTRPKVLAYLIRPSLLNIMSGLCLGLNYIGYTKGVELTTASNTQILIQVGPLILMLIGIFVFKEIFSRLQALGMLIATAGFLLFYQDQISVFISDSERYNVGIIWTLIAAISWASFASIQKVLVAKHSVNGLYLVVFVIPIILLLPAANFSLLYHLSLVQKIVIVYLGINTLVAYGCLGKALQYLEASKTSIIITLNPLLTLFLMSILSKLELTWINPEIINTKGYWGAFFVIMGAILVVYQKPKRNEGLSPQKQTKAATS